METIELKSPEELFQQKELVKMANGIIPLPNTLKWTCRDCKWEFSVLVTLSKFECPVCSHREINFKEADNHLRAIAKEEDLGYKSGVGLGD